MLWHLKDRWEIVAGVVAITALFTVLSLALNYRQGTL